MYVILLISGWAGVVSVVILCTLVPIETSISKRAKAYRKKVLVHSDQRMALIHDVIDGIRTLKLTNMIAFAKEKVSQRRAEELGAAWIGLRLEMINLVLTQSTTIIVSLCTFSTYIWLYSAESLTADMVFSSLAIINVLGRPIFVIPKCISLLSEAQVSLGRIESVVRENPEFYPPGQMRSDPNRGKYVVTDSGSAIVTEVSHVSAGYGGKIDASSSLSTSTPKFFIKDVNVELEGPSLVAIVGPNSSGKSTLMKTLLGECLLLEVQSQIVIRTPHGVIAYCGHEPWIINDTVVYNIMIGRSWMTAKVPSLWSELNPEQQVELSGIMDACSLQEDLANWPDGCDTMIGEKGINVSGGQKARIALARAMYSNAGVVLLDSPLAGLDVSVGAKVFHNAIKALSASRLVLMTTHDLSLLKYSDRILALDNGAVSFDGKLDQFIASGQLSKLQGATSSNVKQQITSAGSPMTGSSPGMPSAAQKQAGGTVADVATNSKSVPSKKSDHVSSGARGNIASKMNQDIDKSGAMSYAVYIEYAKACGLFMSCFALFASMSAFTISVSSDVILAKWTDNKGSSGGAHTSFSLYAIMAGIVVVVNTARYLVYVLAGLRGSQTLHQNLLESILRAPFSFFDRTPSGQVFSRFSGDMDTIDFSIPPGVVSAVDSILGVVSSIALISVFAPTLLVALVPLSLVYIATQARYRKCSRELKRIDSGAKSPIFSQFREVLSGIECVRSYRMHKTLVDQHYEILDRSIRARLNWDAANRWLGIRIDIIGALIVSSAAFFVAAFSNAFTGGLAGLILSYAMKTTNSLSFAIRSSTALENLFTAPERVVQYSSIPSEASMQTSRPSETAAACSRREASAVAEGSSAVVRSCWPSFGSTSRRDGYVPIPNSEAMNGGQEVDVENLLGKLMPASLIGSYNSDSGSSGPKNLLSARNLRACYGEEGSGVEILHGIDLDLMSGTLVGVCGRTGAGKSTLVLSLARAIEAFRNPVASSLDLCGLNAASIPLDIYRAFVQVYPQDYYILSGTVRDAIDPFRRHSDAELRDLIAQFGSATSASSSSSPYGSTSAGGDVDSGTTLDLSTLITAGGQNLSAGQRQVVAFVRAALTEALVVVLDEFNSNMDLIASHRAFAILRYTSY